MLEARLLNKSFGETVVLRDVSIEVHRGQCTCLLGPNGAGKTMLLQCLAQVLLPDSGEIELDGQKTTFPLEVRKHRGPWPKVTVLFQNIAHWPHLTFRQSLQLVTGHKKLPENVLSLIERLGVTELLDRLPHRCSGGQRQRFGLVRSLALNPDYLLVDEPTAAVDLAAATQIAEILNEAKENGLGILAITHQLGFASRIADSVCFMADGENVETGNRTLLKRAVDPRAAAFLEMVQAH